MKTRTTQALNRFWQDYVVGKLHDIEMLTNLSASWEQEATPDHLRAQLNALLPAKNDNLHIGYIVGTCSPTTRGHLATGLQAASQLDLDAVFFVLWPFHYIPGFHAGPLTDWVTQQKHLPWGERMKLLKMSVEDVAELRLLPLYEVREWYEESATRAYDLSDGRTAFWTGTWYVIRKLQWWAQRILRNVELSYTFICGEDQFNPNVHQLLFSERTEKVWKDYSIARQLAIHNMYVVPRSSIGGHSVSVEYFLEPWGVEHSVRIGEPHEFATLSATRIRSREVEPQSLEGCVTERVAAYIRQEGLWGYSA